MDSAVLVLAMGSVAHSMAGAAQQATTVVQGASLVSATVAPPLLLLLPSRPRPMEPAPVPTASLARAIQKVTAAVSMDGVARQADIVVQAANQALERVRLVKLFDLILCSMLIKTVNCSLLTVFPLS